MNTTIEVDDLVKKIVARVASELAREEAKPPTSVNQIVEAAVKAQRA